MILRLYRVGLLRESQLKTVNVVIKGVSPLLINRFKESDEQPLAVKKGEVDDQTSFFLNAIVTNRYRKD